jgi:hypothetical protein
VIALFPTKLSGGVASTRFMHMSRAGALWLEADRKGPHGCGF